MWDFGQADLLEPEAIGEPGKRMFRLRVMSGAGDAASLWLEKEQLAALTLAIRQLVEQTGGDLDEPEPSSAATFPDRPEVDFKIGKLGIGYDEGQRTVAIFAYEIAEEEPDDDASPAFSCRASLPQCNRFADRAEEVISGGRPLCILCGGPIDKQGHDCPRRNGHSKRPIALEE
jgi:uncharacterized repeat protein (TIGR03847 family)